MSTSKERIYKAYWLRTECMTDVKTQGYVGITKNSIYHRFGQHCHSNRPVGTTIREIGEDNIIISELSRGTYEEISNLEATLRPQRFIGWNILAGAGVQTVRCSGCNVHLPKRATGAQCELCNDSKFPLGHKPHNWGKGRLVELIDPSGVVYHPEALTVFCKEHGLVPQNVRKVARGDRRHTQQWKARYL